MQPSLQLSLQLSFGSAIELRSWQLEGFRVLPKQDGRISQILVNRKLMGVLNGHPVEANW